YAGRLGDADLEDRLLRDVDEGRFRAICRNALEGLAAKKLNLEMLVERRGQAPGRGGGARTTPRPPARASAFVAPPPLPPGPPPQYVRPAPNPLGPPPLRGRPRLEAAAAGRQIPPLLLGPGDRGGAAPGVGYPRPPAVRGGPPAHFDTGPA